MNIKMMIAQEIIKGNAFVSKGMEVVKIRLEEPESDLLSECHKLGYKAQIVNEDMLGAEIPVLYIEWSNYG